jgi:curved DNA-binding protein CbpA
MKTVYDVLGVAPDADDRAIRTAFRKSAKVYHPDISGGDHAAEEQFKRITAAHDLIKSPERRAAYDRHLCLKRQQIRRRWKITIAEGTILALISAGAVGVIAPNFVKSAPKESNVNESLLTKSPAHQLEAILGMTTEHARAAGTASIQIPSDTAATGLRTTGAGTVPPSAEFGGTRAIERKTARQSQTLGRKSHQHRYASRTGSRGTVLAAGFAALWNLRMALDGALYRQWRSLRDL